MPKFKVTLRQWHHMRTEGPFFNPFRARDIFRKRPCTHRVWQFEAKDEAEVRRFYDEAKAANHENVRGFDLIRIEQISPSDVAQR